MTPPLSPALSRALALTILAALLWLGYSAIARPLLDKYEAARSSAEELSMALSRAGRISGKAARLRAELDQLKQHRPSAMDFLQSANESLAAAELQNRIKSSVEAAHGELRSTQILPARDDGAFRQIAVRGQIAVTLAALQRIFYDFESSPPFLFLDNVEIRVRNARPAGDRAAEDPVLEVRFDLSGYMRRPA
jgi:general secretion pathway protein M